MRRLSVFLVAATVALWAPSGARAADAGAPDGGSSNNTVPACVVVNTASRYVPYGYNHVVVIKNGCSKSVTCTVSTDVNPKPAQAEVATNATVEVLTFAGSPAATFFARVSCKLN